MGDANGDDVVNALGAEFLTESQKKSADCNRGGEADASDSLLILKSLVDLVTLS
ncbi:MAG: hypothetical protein IJN11_00215 [Oscillospiraceae bacterium]|nr:hypothetical protein [Oscillospiraceae bacterium]